MVKSRPRILIVPVLAVAAAWLLTPAAATDDAPHFTPHDSEVATAAPPPDEPRRAAASSPTVDVLEKYGSVEGFVRDEHDRPTSAVVRISTRHGVVEHEATDGTYRFPEVPAGRFVISASKSGYRPVAFDAWELREGAEVQLYLRFEDVGTLCGVVSNYDGTAPEDAWVLLMDGDVRVTQTKASHDGDWCFDVEPAEGQELIAVSTHEQSSERVTIGEDWHSIDLRLRRGAHLMGEVVTPDGVKVEASIRIEDAQFDGPRRLDDDFVLFPPSHPVRNGHVDLMLRPGRYWLVVRSGDFAPTRFGPLELRETTWQTFELSKGGTIRGVVTDEEGQPLEGVDVGTPRWSPYLPLNATTDADGRFEISGFRLGRQNIMFRKRGYDYRIEVAELERDGTTFELDAKLAQGDGVSFGGVGLTFSNETQAIVDSVVPDGPAAQAGVLPGDVIETVAGLSVDEMSSKQIVAQLRGEVGEVVVVGFRRGNDQLEHRLERQPFRIEP